MKKYYITTPIYYLNSLPHIGHAYTTIAADIIARYWRRKGEEVFFLTGTDEHGIKIAKAAQKAGLDPKKFVDKNSRVYSSLWKKLDISYDDFIRTSEKRHEKAVEEFLNRLKNAETPKKRTVLYEAEYSGLYCEGCEAYKNETDLVDGICPDHKTKPTILKENNWFFRLSDYDPVLKKQIGLNRMQILPEVRQKEVVGFIKQGLADFAISRANVGWGVRLPFDRKQTVYVWVDALINYLSAIGWPDETKFKKLWPADLHLMGKDILKFHGVIWPAMLTALNIDLPKRIFIHGFFTVGGEKMSKTIGNVIKTEELLKRYGLDATRYLLISAFPFGQDGDIFIETFDKKYKGVLADGLGNLLSRVLNLVEKSYDGKIPVAVPSPRKLTSVGKYLEEQKIGQAISTIEDAIVFANQYIDRVKLWQMVKTNKDEAGIVVSGLCSLLREIGLALEPFTPSTSAEIVNRLDSDKIKKGKPLFPSIK